MVESLSLPDMFRGGKDPECDGGSETGDSGVWYMHLGVRSHSYRWFAEPPCHWFCLSLFRIRKLFSLAFAFHISPSLDSDLNREEVCLRQILSLSDDEEVFTVHYILEIKDQLKTDVIMDDSMLFPSYHQLTKICSNKNLTSECNAFKRTFFLSF